MLENVYDIIPGDLEIFERLRLHNVGCVWTAAI